MTHLETDLYNALNSLVKELTGQKKECGHEFDCVCAMEQATNLLKEIKIRMVKNEHHH